MKTRPPERIGAPFLMRPCLAAGVLAASLFFAQAQAQVNLSLGLSVPGVDIGINVPSYPRLVRVPGYPVYYDEQANSNYFFYDGLYWVYREDGWYQSSWYNGPWRYTPNEAVPLFVLRVPVRYYRRPPSYFRGWQANAAPRWGEHWGPAWQREHEGWERWDRSRPPPVAPLPTYQRHYSGEQYPHAPERQRELHEQNYRHPGYAPGDQPGRDHR